MYGRVKCSKFSSSILYSTVSGVDFALEGLRNHFAVFGTGTHSSLWKDYAITLVLVHNKVIAFGILNVPQCCATRAGHLGTVAEAAGFRNIVVQTNQGL